MPPVPLGDLAAINSLSKNRVKVWLPGPLCVLQCRISPLTLR
jgi:hypothetical protein